MLRRDRIGRAVMEAWPLVRTTCVTQKTDMSLNLSAVQRIAHLARIQLSSDEMEATLSQLNGIFALIEKMQSIDTSHVAPLTTPLAAATDVALRFRDDKVTEADRRSDYQGVAPSIEEGLYLVPRVIE